METRVLKQAIQRNRERFAKDFMFQLSVSEIDRLRSHFDIQSGRQGAQRVLDRRNAVHCIPMTELKVTLPDRLARKAREAGLLSPKAIQRLLREAMRRRAAAREFLAVADRVADAGVPSLSEEEIQAEVDAVRKAHRRRRGAQARR